MRHAALLTASILTTLFAAGCGDDNGGSGPSGGSDFEIRVSAGTAPSYSWDAGDAFSLSVVRTDAPTTIVWGIATPGRDGIASPVTHGSTPAGAVQSAAVETELSPGVEYRVSVSRTSGETGFVEFTPEGDAPQPTADPTDNPTPDPSDDPSPDPTPDPTEDPTPDPTEPPGDAACALDGSEDCISVNFDGSTRNFAETQSVLNLGASYRITVVPPAAIGINLVFGFSTPEGDPPHVSECGAMGVLVQLMGAEVGTRTTDAGATSSCRVEITDFGQRIVGSFTAQMGNLFNPNDDALAISSRFNFENPAFMPPMPMDVNASAKVNGELLEFVNSTVTVVENGNTVVSNVTLPTILLSFPSNGPGVYNCGEAFTSLRISKPGGLWALNVNQMPEDGFGCRIEVTEVGAPGEAVSGTFTATLPGTIGGTGEVTEGRFEIVR